ncbi:MAG: hypothetical protein EU533_00780 [Promethearchaeota archaeon]|nr:MAG: hypothetical protein EU533_00780 [Candidatus Lokiarchaeota archaeon]
MMEEILPTLKEKIQEKIHIKEDESNLSLTITISGTLFGKIAYLGEIETMLVMFGGLNRDFPKHVSVNEEAQTIEIRVENQADYLLLQTAFKKIWDNAIFMFSEILKGNFDVIKDIPEIDD